MLEDYAQKRRFNRTPEPPPRDTQGGGDSLTFVVQKHAARRLHYDFRLELDGVLKSWSVPHGPSLDPETKRLAVMVEDHPLEYASYEGVIPKGEYGAGQVIVWDTGTYMAQADDRVILTDRTQAQVRLRDGLNKGKISFLLYGQKLKGSWTLVKMKSHDKDWLLIKHHDEFADPEYDILQDEHSVISGLSIEDLKAGHLPDPQESRVIDLEKIPGNRKTSFPSSVTPMLASLTGRPFSDPDWIFEPKLDGFRILASVRDGNITLLSRHQVDVTAHYPFLAAELKQQSGREMIIDGEIVALDSSGRPCFQCLQQYLKHSKQVGKAETSVAVIYYVFDLLYLDGYDLRDATLQQRRRLLEQTVKPTEHVRLVEQFEGDGQTIFDAAIANGLEGVIAKHKGSVYRSGERSRDWLKIKSALSDEFVIGGYTQGQGSRAHTFGALLLGYYDDGGRLVYAGHVGTGFDTT
ncbi:MAG: non-homologous end-joining DNA ligase, partial [Dehalococcoidales bacterium]|nr:non-homologous end-joining DNA ligase [Dehalococcoidales bacterium]